tara:strand:- start:343 stop:573 length:231 start_codon:yes stop_codon:yes gene_type:complete
LTVSGVLPVPPKYIFPIQIDIILENFSFLTLLTRKLLIIIGIVKGINKYEKKLGFFKFQKRGLLKFILLNVFINFF